MPEGLHTLNEREREALRLLIGAHDAKSIATHLGVSVNSVNERLRDARRKLGVSSSREAARLLAECEQSPDNFLGNKELRIDSTAAREPERAQPHRSPGSGYRLAWLGGGMIIMSLIIAAVALSAVFQPGAASNATSAPATAAAPAASSEAQSAVASAARSWVELVDQKQWERSWTEAGSMFRSQITQAVWASTIKGVREPLGTVSSRSLLSVTEKDSLPGAPAGEYRIVQFRTSFANKPDSTETVVLAHEFFGWKVVGYFIK